MSKTNDIVFPLAMTYGKKPKNLNFLSDSVDLIKNYT